MPDLALSDKYRREEGTIFLTGVEAIIRLLLDKQRDDRDAGRAVNQTFVTGYEGSPLGGLDLQGTVVLTFEKMRHGGELDSERGREGAKSLAIVARRRL